METKKVIKIGNSNGIVLGKTVEILSGITFGDTVKVTVKKGKIIIEKETIRTTYSEWTNKDSLTPPSGQYTNPNFSTSISLNSCTVTF